MTRRAWVILIPVIALLVAMAGPAAASPVSDDGGPMIYLQRATFDPLAAEPGVNGLTAELAQPAADSTVFLVQFDGPVQDEWKASLGAIGAELLGYVPDHAFLVRLGDLSPDVIRELPHVRWVGSYLAGYKVATTLDAAIGSDEPMTMVISLFPGESRDAVEGILQSMGGQIEDVAVSELLGDAIRVSLPASRVPELALLRQVSWVEPYLPMELTNDRAADIMGVTTARSALAGQGVDLYGAGQIVDVVDTGLDTGDQSTLSLDFQGRVEKTYALGRAGDWSDGTEAGGHGTHVAGSVLGSGRLSGSVPASHDYNSSFAGVAPEAGLIFQSVMDSSGTLMGIPTDLKQLFQPAHDDGARIHTNSWGHPTGGSYPNVEYGGYDSVARYADEFMWQNPHSLLLFSAGNSGVDGNSDGVIDLDQMLSPGTAKNVLTVGATENNRPPGAGWGGYSNTVWGTGSWEARYPANPIHDDFISDDTGGMAAFSSRGPTDDGRIKPELVAPGTDIISARSHAAGAGTGWGVYNSHYIYNGGTSMSTPLVAGAAALVRQYYADVGGYATPTAALVKATLINGGADIAPGQYGTGGAQEIPTSNPNPVTGFGRANVTNSLALNAHERLRFWDVTPGLSTGTSTTYTVTVTQAGAAGDQFAATLCWTDYPGQAYAAKALVNDLDLEVVGPDDTRYKGNGKAIWDRMNTVERVVIQAPKAGTYQLIVRGYTAPNGPQPFALVVASDYLAPAPVLDLDQKALLPVLGRAYGAPIPETVTLTSVADATILQGYPSQNFGDTYDMWAGYDDYLEPDGMIARSLVRFNVSGIPSGAMIDSAKLRAYYMGYYDWAGHVDTITAYRAIGNWTEGAVTWNARPSVGAAYGSVDIAADANYRYVDLDVTGLVQSWVNGTVANHGVVLRGPEASGNDSSWRSFYTREGAYPPKLVVTYTASGSLAAPSETPDVSVSGSGLSIQDTLGSPPASAAEDGKQLEQMP